MRKLIIIPLLLTLVLSLSGCLEILADDSAKLIGDWVRDGNSSYRVRLQKNGQGVALNKATNDYTFEWRLDPDEANIMYWEIDGASTRVVHYYLLKEDSILVLEWDGMPTVYERG